jgi:RimJ/RimL family protein N-acetyltransferase
MASSREVEGWRGERSRLVPPDRKYHLENAYRWFNDPAVTFNIKLNLGASRRQEEAFFDRIESRATNEYVWAILDLADRHIGFIGLHEINLRNRWATGGILIGDQSVWGRGHASDAVNLRSRFAFEQLGLHRIEGHTMNPAMRRVYEKCGYRHEGIAHRKFWRDGRWHDSDLYAILDEDWFRDRVEPGIAPEPPIGESSIASVTAETSGRG